MAYGLSNGHVIDDVTWPWKVKLVTPIRLERNISKTTWARDFKFGMQLCMGNAEQVAQINFPESGRGLGHVTPTIFGSTVGYPSDSLASCFVSYGGLRCVLCRFSGRCNTVYSSHFPLKDYESYKGEKNRKYREWFTVRRDWMAFNLSRAATDREPDWTIYWQTVR